MVTTTRLNQSTELPGSSLSKMKRSLAIVEGINFICQPEKPTRRLIGTSMQSTRFQGPLSNDNPPSSRGTMPSYLQPKRSPIGVQHSLLARSKLMTPNHAGPTSAPGVHGPGELPRLQKTARIAVNMLPQGFPFTNHRQSTLAALHQAKNIELLQSMSRDAEEVQTDGLDTTQSSHLFKQEIANGERGGPEERHKDAEATAQTDASMRKDQ